MNRNRIFWGLAIVAAGLLLVLGALGIGEQIGLLRIVATLLLLGIAIEGLFRLHFLVFFIPVAVGVYLWRGQLGLASVNLGLLLVAAVLLGIGLSIVFRRSNISGHVYHHVHADNWRKSDETVTVGETLNLTVSFGEETKRIHAGTLRQVNIDTNFAQATAIFEEAQLPPEGLDIHINGNFSETVLVIPRTWTADSNRVTAFAGTVKGLSGHNGGPANVRLTGSVHFGEIRLEYL